MAKIQQCNVWAQAKQHRLVSDRPAYAFQVLYITGKCKGHIKTRKPDGSESISLCPEEKHMQWRGEFSDGTFTQFFEIDSNHSHLWERRTETDPARPEAQLMSEYSERAAKPADVTGSYHDTLKAAKSWHKGRKVREQLPVDNPAGLASGGDLLKGAQ